MNNIFKQYKYEVLDSSGNKTNKTKWYLDIHRDGDWHRGVHVWIITESGEILIHKRSDFVHTFPGMYENSCGGHVDLGKTSLQSAQKETEEELGLKLSDANFVFIGTVIDQYETETVLHGHCINNEFDDVFIVWVKEKISLHIAENEVKEVKWIHYFDFKNDLKVNAHYHVYRPQEHEFLLTYLKAKFSKKTKNVSMFKWIIKLISKAKR